jgi:hypothetical protein
MLRSPGHGLSRHYRLSASLQEGKRFTRDYSGMTLEPDNYAVKP